MTYVNCFLMILTIFSSTVHSSSTEDSFNLFRMVNKKLEMTLNKLFQNLKLGNDFMKQNSTQKNLKKYNRLKKEFNENYNYFKEIKRVCLDDQLKRNNTIDLIAHNPNITNDEVLANIIYTLNMTATLQDKLQQITERTKKPEKDTDYNFSDESLKIFIKKIHDLSVDDFVFYREDNNSEEITGEIEANITSSDELPDTRRIFEGKRKKIRQYPYFASVHVLQKFACGGAIVSRDVVITAASCLQIAHNNRFFRENPRLIHVRVGSNYRNFGGEVIPSMEVYFHPSYNPKTLHNNIALIRLYKKIFFKRRKNVEEIEFDQYDHPMPGNVDGILILGWGSKSFSNMDKTSYYYPMFGAKIDIYPFLECQKVYLAEYVTHKMFCGGYFSKGGGACNRDVGGPAVVSDTLVGIVSFGAPVCGAPDQPTVFTKVGYYAKWIQEIIDSETQIPTRHGMLNYVISSTLAAPTVSGFVETSRLILNQFNIDESDTQYDPARARLNQLTTEIAYGASLAQLIKARDKNVQDIIYNSADQSAQNHAESENQAAIESLPEIDNQAEIKNQVEIENKAAIEKVAAEYANISMSKEYSQFGGKHNEVRRKHNNKQKTYYPQNDVSVERYNQENNVNSVLRQSENSWSDVEPSKNYDQSQRTSVHPLNPESAQVTQNIFEQYQDPNGNFDQYDFMSLTSQNYQLKQNQSQQTQNYNGEDIFNKYEQFDNSNDNKRRQESNQPIRRQTINDEAVVGYKVGSGHHAMLFKNRQ